MKRKLIIGTIILIVVAAAAYTAVSYVLYNQLTDIEGGCDKHAANKPDSFTDMAGYWPDGFDFTPYYISDYETVRFPSREEGFEIVGWYVETSPEAPAVLLVHGIGSCKNSHTILTPAGMLHNAGFNVLMIDVRDAGESSYEDGRSAIGNEEYLDALGGWDWLVNTKGFPPERVGILGNSLGAATALIAFSEEPDLAAIFVDSPFDNLPQIIQEELARNNYPVILTPGGIWMARLVAGDNITAHNPYEALEKANDRPIFILHGTADRRIDVQHSLQLQTRAEENGANATFWIVEGVDHVRAAADMPEAYAERLITFFSAALDQ